MLESDDLLTEVTLIGGFFGGLRFGSIVFSCGSCLGEGTVAHVVLGEVFVGHVVVDVVVAVVVTKEKRTSQGRNEQNELNFCFLLRFKTLC